MNPLILVVDDEPDVEVLFRQQFRHDLRAGRFTMEFSERRAPLSAAGYQRMVARAGVAAKFTFLVHSHMLRHACGFKLATMPPAAALLQGVAAFKPLTDH